MRSLGALIFLPLAACTSVEPIDLGPPATAAPCSRAMLDDFNREPATSEVGAALLRMNRKTALRWVQPGMMVTMDFREDRLTVYLDAANRVERASCS